MKVGLKNIKAFEFCREGKELFALTGDVRVECGTLFGGSITSLNPNIVDIVYEGDGYYTADGDKITSFVDPADFMPKNINSGYKFITMRKDGAWYAWAGIREEPLEFDEDKDRFIDRSNKGYISDLVILSIPHDPLGARFALYCRKEDGSWKRYFKEEN